ncbi:MAG: FKBP-type peptidyl-prolyl cis-trans isomerase [Saprospiraceae bacterium]
MKKQFLTLGLLCTIIGFAQAQKPTKMDSLSYSLGVLVAQNLKNQGFDNIVPADFAQAVNDVMKGAQCQVDAAQANEIVQSHFAANAAKKEASSAGDAKDNMEIGKKYLADNGKRKEVITLASGLQYEILKPGSGPKPKSTDEVTVHYKGTLINGFEFDSSIKRGQPATFPVNGVIKGWTEALQLMGEGSKWKLFIPADLAYGNSGAGADIKPGSTLIFEVELIKVN